VSFQTLRDLPATDLQVGDWPVSLAGYRPVTRIKNYPRKHMVRVWTDAEPKGIELYHTDTIKRVRRPVMAAMQFVRTFDPSEAANA
jgi:hypothetical protein